MFSTPMFPYGTEYHLHNAYGQLHPYFHQVGCRHSFHGMPVITHRYASHQSFKILMFSQQLLKQTKLGPCLHLLLYPFFLAG